MFTNLINIQLFQWRNASETAIVRGHGTNPIDANHTAVLICRRTATSELHVVTAYRHGERQEVQHQGGHGRQLAFNGQTA